MSLIQLEPAYQDYVWGGERIRSYFQRAIEPGRYAESWEVSDRNEGMSKVASGPLKGKTLKELLGHRFPLLVKVIDSAQHLSVQVHPDEEAALRLQAEPKSEMWIALEKSTVFAGLKPGVNESIFRQALEENRVEDLLNRFILEKGESVFIPAGVVHAIGAGAFILEVQQNSNTTYRLYDWGRTGRELHLEKGLSCVKFDHIMKKNTPTKFQGGKTLIKNKYFTVQRLDVEDSIDIPQEESFQILFCSWGRAQVEETKIYPGTTYLISPGVEVRIHGTSEFILVKQALCSEMRFCRDSASSKSRLE